MARKEVFTKEDILSKSILYIKEYGIDSLSVRNLAKYIGCSTQPLFKYYKNMDEFKDDLNTYLKSYYELFINKYIDKDDYLVTFSYAHIMYAKNESNLFKATFLRNYDTFIDRDIQSIISIRMRYNISHDKAVDLYRDNYFYIHGLAVKVCNKSIKLSNEEIYNLIDNMINIYIR